MNQLEKGILLLTCIAVALVILWDLKGLKRTEMKPLIIIGTILLIGMASRYITLSIYALSTDVKLLETIRYFYYASSVGLTMLTVCIIWFIVPLYNEKVDLGSFILFFIPFILFYGYLIVTQPTRLVESSAYGYELSLIPPFDRYLAFVQGSFIVVVTILCLIGLVRYKHLQIRIELVILLLAQGLLVIDGIYSGKDQIFIFKLFTVSEGFTLWTIGYALYHPFRRLRVIRNKTINKKDVS